MSLKAFLILGSSPPYYGKSLSYRLLSTPQASRCLCCNVLVLMWMICPLLLSLVTRQDRLPLLIWSFSPRQVSWMNFGLYILLLIYAYKSLMFISVSLIHIWFLCAFLDSVVNFYFVHSSYILTGFLAFTCFFYLLHILSV